MEIYFTAKEAEVFEHRAEAFRQFRAAGWILHKDNTATCPQCRNLPKEK